MNLLEASTKIATLGTAIVAREKIALEAGGRKLEEQMKSVMGTYEYGWPVLAESTVAKKGADTPLVETGELRDSIEHTVSGRSVFVGSDEDKAVWHERGTKTIPPRSFLAETGVRHGGEAVKVVAEELIGALIGR